MAINFLEGKEPLPEGSTRGVINFLEGTSVIDEAVRESLQTPSQDDQNPFRERLVESLFKAEGGYSTDRSDSGNYYQGQFIGTNHGVSAPVLARHLGRTPTVEDMKGLSKEVAADIAFNDYYERFNISALPEDLQEIVFHSVYLGESRGVKAMQRLLGVTVDGAVGPETTEAMRTADFSKEDFRDAFIEELRKTKTWDEHGKGWTNRFNELAQ